MESKVDIRSKITSWINSTFQSYGFDSITVDISGSSEKGDGYLGDIVFVRATCLKVGNDPQIFDLCVKYGKMSKTLRERLPIEIVFKREVFMYGTVFPILRRLEEKRNLRILDNFLAKCFYTQQKEGEEIIILQNAKTIGYELHDRFEPFDVNHLKLTLQNYGRLHALGIAYRDKHPEEFYREISSMENVWVKLFPTFKRFADNSQTILYSAFEEKGDLLAVKRFKDIFEESMYDTAERFIRMREENCVITHGDCWNNNFMFKYDGEDKLNPKAVVFLDFQVADVGSPVYDLSYHLYATASDVALQELDTLLRLYYDSLSSTLTQLGSNPEKLFPYEELIRQWKKYSLFGLIMGLCIIPSALTEKEDTFDIQTMDDGEIDRMYDNLKNKNIDRVYSRVYSIGKHFLAFNRLDEQS